MNKSALFFVCMVLVLLNFKSEADVGKVIILDPRSSGTGCPEGTVSFTVSPDNTAVSVLFSNYILNIGGSTRLKQGRISCTLLIPLQLPKGVQASVIGIDYRGFSLLPKEGQMVLKTKDGYLINGTKYEDTSDSDHEFAGPFSDNFIFSRKKKSLKWTSCGGRIDLDLQTQVLMVTNDKRDEAIFSMDSADITTGFKYKLALRPCNEKN